VPPSAPTPFAQAHPTFNSISPLFSCIYHISTHLWFHLILICAICPDLLFIHESFACPSEEYRFSFDMNKVGFSIDRFLNLLGIMR